MLRTQTLKNFIHLLFAVAANIYYGFPGSKLKVIGVTGTDGKTTTSHLLYHILKMCGKKVSMISTVYAMIGEKEYETGLHTTTPSPFLVQKLLRQAADAGDEYFVLETTSHALDQNRVFGIPYVVSVITNITREHLDYHKTQEAYIATKAKLLLKSELSILNKDDSSFKELKRILETNDKPFKTFSLKTHQSDYQFDYTQIVPGIPEYNNYNILAAYSVCRNLGIEEDEIVKALKNFKLPKGRLEVFHGKDFTVIVDFAHTPNSLKSFLVSLRKYVKKGNKLIHVFGSAGLRDAGKRPLMGEVSGAHADEIIVTEEDYRSEDPEKISQDIVKGIEKAGNKKYSIILNREHAITKAIEGAQKGDLVVITGKGHEKSLARGDKEVPWSDQETVKNLLGITQ